MPTQFFSFSPSEISIAVVVFDLVLTSLLSLVIAWVHKKTHKGLSYSSSFFATIVLMGAIATIIMLVVQNNIFGAVGLLGAFALIRFRTIIKETRDIAFLFFALAEGVAVGLGYYAIALVSTAFVSILAYILFKYNWGSSVSNKFIVLMTAKKSVDVKQLSQLFKDVHMELDFLSGKKRTDALHEYTFSVKTKDMTNITRTLDMLSPQLSIDSYDVLSGKESIEY